MAGAAHRHNTLLGVRLFLVPPGTAKDDVIATAVERDLEGLRPHDQGIAVTMIERINARRAPFLICIDDELEVMLGREIVTERD